MNEVKQDTQSVRLVHLDVPFLDLVVFLFKVSVAAIPAAIMFVIFLAFVATFFRSLIGGI